MPEGELKEKADAIFSRSGVITALRKSDRKVLEAEGFNLFNAWGNVIARHRELEGWVIKCGNRIPVMYCTYKRVKLADKIRKYLERQELSHIVVPQKYLYHLPGQSNKLSDHNYLVFAERLKLQSKTLPRVLPREAIKEAISVIRHFGLADTHKANFGIVEGNKIAIVDTEPIMGMGNGLWSLLLDNPLVHKGRGVVGVMLFKYSLDAENEKRRPVPTAM